MGNLTTVGNAQRSDEVGMLGKQSIRRRFIAEPAVTQQPHIWRTVFHQQPEHILMCKLPGDLMGGYMPAERPLVNRSATLRVDLWKILVVHAHANAIGIRVELPASKGNVAECGCHEEVGLAA